MKLDFVKKEQHRLTRKLNRSQLELVTRTNVAESMLSSVPGVHLDELEHKDRQVGRQLPHPLFVCVCARVKVNSIIITRLLTHCIWWEDRLCR
jgi:hypothetical protein